MKEKYELIFVDLHSDLMLSAWWPEERPVPAVGKDVALLTDPNIKHKQPKMAKIIKVMEFYAASRSVLPAGYGDVSEVWSKQVFVSIELRDLSPSDMPEAVSAFLVEGNKPDFPS